MLNSGQKKLLEVFEVITGFQLLSILHSSPPNLKLRIVEHFYISVGSLISLENSVFELQIFDILLGIQAKCRCPSIKRGTPHSFLEQGRPERRIVIFNDFNKDEQNVVRIDYKKTNLPLKVALQPSWF